MGASELRDAFNAVASPRYVCARATLQYEHASDVEWQILSFSGTGSDGVAFTVKSDRLRPHSDVTVAAAAVAQGLLDKKEALS